MAVSGVCPDSTFPSSQLLYEELGQSRLEEQCTWSQLRTGRSLEYTEKNESMKTSSPRFSNCPSVMLFRRSIKTKRTFVVAVVAAKPTSIIKTKFSHNLYMRPQRKEKAREVLTQISNQFIRIQLKINVQYVVLDRIFSKVARFQVFLPAIP